MALPAVIRAPLMVMVLPALKKSHPSHKIRVPRVTDPVSFPDKAASYLSNKIFLTF